MTIRPSPKPGPVPSPLPKGLVCPKCGCQHFEVLSTRGAPSGAVRRRRQCRHCGRRVTTVERPVG
ncbi:MAG: transposase [Phycisphaeraceae bacterium]|nr:transposase [Phycisphaeraceae bacterium]QOJ00871.1 MAG: transposase [Phycisphaeraceae bacterium]